jgi:hypothetical protein
MCGENDARVSTERLLGAELVRAAEGLLAGMSTEGRDAALDAQLATVQVLLGLYWELRHQGRLGPVTTAVAADGATAETGGDASIEWLSALFSSVRPESVNTTGPGRRVRDHSPRRPGLPG